jgi:hypothetical protein
MVDKLNLEYINKDSFSREPTLPEDIILFSYGSQHVEVQYTFDYDSYPFVVTHWIDNFDAVRTRDYFRSFSDAIIRLHEVVGAL